MDPHIVILAAGQGKRMRSKLPKVLHPVLFRPMLHSVLDLAGSISAQSISIVVGHDNDQVQDSCAGYRGLRFFRQDVPLGTGHALRAVEPFLKPLQGDVLVLSGDVILLERASLRRMLDRHVRERAACTLGTTALTQPNGYGRVLRHMDGRVAAVREEPDCSPAEKFINEVNAGVYVFRIDTLFDALARITNENVQKEYYLPDVVRPLSAAGELVLPYCFGDPQEVMGIDDRLGLARAEDVLRRRVNSELMSRGVSLQDPASTWVDPRCRFGEDVRIEGGCVLVASVLEDEVTVESHCRVVESAVGRGTRLKQGCYVEKSLVGSGCAVGPYAHLRPGSTLDRNVRVGGFVEVKARGRAPAPRAPEHVQA